MSGKPARTIARGRSLLIRTSSSPRPGKTFFPPDAIIEEYANFADAHNGRVLWTMGPTNMETLETVQNVIVYSHASGNALIGRIVGADHKYDPEAWAKNHSDDMDFVAPEPWSHEPAATWIALEKVRVGHILLSDYRTLNGNNTLKDLMSGSGSGKVLVECLRG